MCFESRCCLGNVSPVAGIGEVGEVLDSGDEDNVAIWVQSGGNVSAWAQGVMSASRAVSSAPSICRERTCAQDSVARGAATKASKFAKPRLGTPFSRAAQRGAATKASKFAKPRLGTPFSRAAHLAASDFRHESRMTLSEKREQPDFAGNVFGTYPGMDDRARRAAIQQDNSHGLTQRPRRQCRPGRAASRPA